MNQNREFNILLLIPRNRHEIVLRCALLDGLDNAAEGHAHIDSIEMGYCCWVQGEPSYLLVWNSKQL